MNVAVRSRGSQEQHRPASHGRGARLILLAASAGVLAAPAASQVSGVISLDSDYRLRGYSLSEERPAATASLYYDHPNGAYAAASVVGVWRGDEPDFLSVQGNVGFAKRLARGLILDGGIYRAHYRQYRYRARTNHYTEIYVGIGSRRIQSKIYFSPDYFRDGAATLYGEVDGSADLGARVRLRGHVGALTYIDGRLPYESRTTFDWRLTAARPFGPIEARVTLSGRQSGTRYYGSSSHDTVLVVGASFAF